MINGLYRKCRNAWKKETARKPPDFRVRLSGVEGECRLGDKVVPSRTTVTIVDLPDTAIVATDTDRTVYDFTVRSNDTRAHLKGMRLDDVPEGSLNDVESATLYREFGPNVWVPIRTAVPVNGQLVFNQFGSIATSGAGVHFQVRLNARDSLVGSTRMELGVVGLNIPYGGQFDFTAAPSPDCNGDDYRLLWQGGPQRTHFSITTFPTVPTITPGSRDVVVYDYVVKSTDFRSYVNCARFDDTPQGALNFVQRGTIYLETAPGFWYPLQTVPVTYGRLIFGRTSLSPYGRVYSGGLGAHLQVRVDAKTNFVGSVPISLGIYKSTIPYAGIRTFGSYAPEPAHGQQLSVSSIFYDAQPGTNVRVGDFTVGIGERLCFHTLELRAGSGAFTGMTNIRLQRLDAGGNPYGPPLGTVILLDADTLVIDDIDAVIHWSDRFRLTADLITSVQLDQAIALS